MTAVRMNHARWIASLGGLGYFPFASGTIASLVAAGVGAAALWFGHHLLMWLTIAVCLIGLWAVHVCRRDPEADVDNDPGWIVIDECAGQWIALLGLLTLSWRGVIAAFVLFRILDIAKPSVIGWADRRHGAFGIMADDIIAGAIVAVVLIVITRLFPDF